MPVSDRNLLYDTWNKGKVDIQPISHADIRYTLTYIDKQVFGANALYEAYGDFQPPFAHFSKGLGFKWVEKHLQDFDEFGTLHFTQTKQYTLPPYMRDKYRFKKPVHLIPNSVRDFAKLHNCSLEEAFTRRQKLIELSNQRKELKNTGIMYDVDKIPGISSKNPRTDFL